jgi:hypothetical protein
MSVVSTTAERVTRHTAAEINKRIERRTDERVKRLAHAGYAAITARLAELDEEWDIERCLETGASSLVVTGTLLGALVDRRWYLLPFGVAAFLLQHAIEGWCPPLPVFRRLGVRTADEINIERYALKALRGDFATLDLSRGNAVETALRGARR